MSSIMRKDFYFFRHGQTDLNVRGVWQGCSSDVLLNATGIKQAEELAKKVSSLQLTDLCSSPLVRAVQTANKIVGKDCNMLPILVYQDLHECQFGDAEGLTFAESEARYGKDFVNNILFPTMKTWNLHFPNGESKCEVFHRVMDCLSLIIKEKSSDEHNRIGVVCHAGVINALQCGLDLKNVSYENCSILHLAYDTLTEEWTQVFD